MKTIFKPFGVFLVIALWIAFGIHMAHAETPKPSHQTLTYKVYAGGINALNAKLDLNLESVSYKTKLSAKTAGFLGKLAPWQGVFSTSGFYKNNGKVQPLTHIAKSVWRGESETKTYSYNRDGSFKKLTIIDEGVDESPKSVDSALTNGTMDILSATLNVMQTTATTGKCAGTSDIFDGKRRFSLKFTPKGAVKLSKSRHNSYEGIAMKCSVEITPDGGKWHEKPRGWLSIQEQGRQKGALPTIWLAQLTPNTPAVPVKVAVKTEFGTLLMHLIDVQNRVIKKAE